MGNPNGRLQHGHKVGGKRSPTYSIWVGMKRRCTDAKFKDFPKYGGAGIKVCDRWAESFIAFLADMGVRPSLDHSIDRLDPSGNYEPSNCRWATALQQLTEHKRDLCPVTIDGISYPNRAAACAAFGVRPSTVSERLKAGYSVEEAITAPKHRLSRTRPRESYLRKGAR
jgi:hypothetical protein